MVGWRSPSDSLLLSSSRFSMQHELICNPAQRIQMRHRTTQALREKFGNDQLFDVLELLDAVEILADSPANSNGTNEQNPHFNGKPNGKAETAFNGKAGSDEQSTTSNAKA